MAETFDEYLEELCEGAETFVCKHCGFTLPIEYRHKENPDFCFMDFISKKDAEFIARVVDEVMTEHGFIRIEA